MGTQPSAQTPEAESDRRRHKRYALELAARFMPSDHSEHEGKIIDISAGGISISSQHAPDIGDSIIFYVQDLGRLEGTVVRHHDDGFACGFSDFPGMHERIADKITLLMNRMSHPDADARIHPRLPTRELAQISLPDGSAYDVRILDMSFGGVSVATGVRPPLGSVVKVGKMAGKVVRHHEKGIAIAFDSVHANWGSLALSLR